MSYTGRVDNIKVTEHNGSVTLEVHNPMAWDNEPQDASVTFKSASINNLIDALRDIQAHQRNTW